MVPQGGRRITNVKGVAKYLDTSIPSVWRGVKRGSLPSPFYTAPRSPRWDLNEVDAALEASRARPADAQEARRQAKLAMAG